MSLYAQKHDNCPTCTCTNPLTAEQLKAISSPNGTKLFKAIKDKKPPLKDAMMVLAEKHQADCDLLELIYKDLKIRADNGVVDISNFIWERLSNRINNS